ncbi:MAG TPA: hypothetical protein VMQ44_01760 [Candidatus Saccharimonadales bacterium]|nr:hypothetical protein [Candidatus Saccharimonadales bacterium]
MRFPDLVSKFNNRLAFAKRVELYELLKKARLLGRVFGSNEQRILMAYLFHKYYGKSWPERTQFQTNVNDRLEEARVEFFLDSQMSYVPTDAENRPRMRGEKERQFHALLEEADFRTDLLMRSREAKLGDGLSLALLPVSLEMLQRLVAAFPRATSIVDLAMVTDDQLKAARFRQPARSRILAHVAERTPKPTPSVLVARVKAQPAQASLFG